MRFGIVLALRAASGVDRANSDCQVAGEADAGLVSLLR